MKEKRERGEDERNSTFFPRSMGFHRSEFVSPRTKVHLSEGYIWVPKTKDFTEDPKKEIWGNWIFRAYEVFSRPPSVLLHSNRYGLFLPWFILTFVDRFLPKGLFGWIFLP